MQQEKTRKIRRIRQISVTNLFGIFNHVISLKMNDRITIIHGPNGFGKTMMLKLLYALLVKAIASFKAYHLMNLESTLRIIPASGLVKPPDHMS